MAAGAEDPVRRRFLEMAVARDGNLAAANREAAEFYRTLRRHRSTSSHRLRLIHAGLQDILLLSLSIVMFRLLLSQRPVTFEEVLQAATDAITTSPESLPLPVFRSLFLSIDTFGTPAADGAFVWAERLQRTERAMLEATLRGFEALRPQDPGPAGTTPAHPLSGPMPADPEEARGVGTAAQAPVQTQFEHTHPVADPTPTHGEVAEAPPDAATPDIMEVDVTAPIPAEDPMTIDPENDADAPGSGVSNEEVPDSTVVTGVVPSPPLADSTSTNPTEDTEAPAGAGSGSLTAPPSVPTTAAVQTHPVVAIGEPIDPAEPPVTESEHSSMWPPIAWDTPRLSPERDQHDPEVGLDALLRGQREEAADGARHRPTTATAPRWRSTERIDDSAPGVREAFPEPPPLPPPPPPSISLATRQFALLPRLMQARLRLRGERDRAARHGGLAAGIGALAISDPIDRRDAANGPPPKQRRLEAEPPSDHSSDQSSSATSSSGSRKRPTPRTKKRGHRRRRP